ncbi:MAG: hypothetical protein V4499_00690 [Pseudomonadota bacterium]
MLDIRRSLAAAMALFGCTIAALGQAQPREPTDLYIRRLAGLPSDSARGQIEIIDVGHDPMSTMLSIVASRTEGGWKVSYGCAASPQCAPGLDHASRTYTLPASASAEVDRLIDKLRSGGEPEDPLRSPGASGGHLLVKINYHGFEREYRRTIMWGETLGKLEALLTDPGGHVIGPGK